MAGRTRCDIHSFTRGFPLYLKTGLFRNGTNTLMKTGICTTLRFLFAKIDSHQSFYRCAP